MSDSSMFIGMDVHQKTIDVTVAEEGRDGECGTSAPSAVISDPSTAPSTSSSSSAALYTSSTKRVYADSSSIDISPPAVSPARWSLPPRCPASPPTASRPTGVTSKNSPAPTAPVNCARRSAARRRSFRRVGWNGFVGYLDRRQNTCLLLAECEWGGTLTSANRTRVVSTELR
jgi:hypothetical protein